MTTKLGDYVAVIRPDHTLTFDGIDFDNGKKPIRVVRRANGILVASLPGRTCWNGNGMPRRYVPAEFIVFRVIKQRGAKLLMDRLIDFPARAPKAS